MGKFYDKPLRGEDRLNDLFALPCLDLGANCGYEGSIAKDGSNADWEWHLYQDNKGEWVLFEQFGAGCLYNMTQHRYPASEEPTFRFYIDDPDTPAFEIKQSEFGHKAPFLAPLAGKYVGPTEGGNRGPIWVIRSFVPVAFTKYCKVTSSVYLSGPEMDKGEGGWGHITYTLYDTAEGIRPFTQKLCTDMPIYHTASGCGEDPKPCGNNLKLRKDTFAVEPGSPVTVFVGQGAGTVSAVKICVKHRNVAKNVLHDLRVRFYWDGEDKPSVDAPMGTFFGNEYKNNYCDNKQLTVGLRFLPPDALMQGYNYFPMPYADGFRMELYTVGAEKIDVWCAQMELTGTDEVAYDFDKTGRFVSSEYYERTDNILGKNSVIATLNGTGHMVYGTISGYRIAAGCEGDVRVFIDGRRSPEIESDGTESWGSYGWGFVTPPEYNAFSGYNGEWDSNSDWSLLRLTVGDSYYFKKQLRFELEHGGTDDGMGAHSGQIFAYMARTPRGQETDRFDVDDASSRKLHGYTAEGVCREREICSAYADGIVYRDNPHTDLIHEGFDRVSFTLDIDEQNRGVVLCRKSCQEKGRQTAKVFVDGKEVAERLWYFCNDNPYYMWRDDFFIVSGAYTRGKKKITVTLEPIAADGKEKTFNLAEIFVISVD